MVYNDNFNVSIRLFRLLAIARSFIHPFCSRSSGGGVHVHAWNNNMWIKHHRIAQKTWLRAQGKAKHRGVPKPPYITVVILYVLNVAPSLQNCTQNIITCADNDDDDDKVDDGNSHEFEFVCVCV